MSRLSEIAISEELIARARGGEEAAQAAIYRGMGPAVFALTRRLVGNRAVAEDLFQDTMMTPFQRLGEFRGESPLGIWLRQIAVTRCLMYLRSPWHRARLQWESGDESTIARRLRTAADESSAAPYEWAEFQRRRHRSILTRAIERNRPVAIAAAVLAAVLVTAAPFIRSSHEHGPVIASPHAAARGGAGDLQEQARTRAIEGWLAALPQEHALVRVGAHAAVTSIQDQIAALDDLMSAARVEGAQPVRLDALERQRAQLVNSLAQVQYAEMLASATP